MAARTMEYPLATRGGELLDVDRDRLAALQTLSQDSSRESYVPKSAPGSAQKLCGYLWPAMLYFGVPEVILHCVPCIGIAEPQRHDQPAQQCMNSAITVARDRHSGTVLLLLNVARPANAAPAWPQNSPFRRVRFPGFPWRGQGNSAISAHEMQFSF